MKYKFDTGIADFYGSGKLIEPHKVAYPFPQHYYIPIMPDFAVYKDENSEIKDPFSISFTTEEYELIHEDAGYTREYSGGFYLHYPRAYYKFKERK